MKFGILPPYVAIQKVEGGGCSRNQRTHSLYIYRVRHMYLNDLHSLYKTQIWPDKKFIL